MDDIFKFAPTLREVSLVLLVAIVTALSLIRDFFERKGRPSLPTAVLSGVSLVFSLFFIYMLIVPRYLPAGESPAMNFVSSDSGVGPIRFAAGGDAHLYGRESRPDITSKILNHIAADRYSLFFFLGDLPDHGFDKRMWLRSVRDITGPNSRVPMGFVPGNHDTMFGGLGLYRHYALPDKDSTLWRRIDRGNVHFLILDLEWAGQTYTRVQAEWLEAQLADIPRRDWCIVLSHTFFFSSGKVRDGWAWYDNQAVISRLVPLFEKSGVDLVLSGHIHQTEVLQRNGITYAVVGSLGGRLAPERVYVSPASVWYEAGLYGFAEVRIDGDSGILAIRDSDDQVRFSLRLRNN